MANRYRTANELITHSRLLEIAHYNPETGDFTHLAIRPGVARGSIAGGLNYYGYIRINLDGIRYLAHRLAWFYVYQTWPTNEIDHINRIKTDNRIANLRDATRSINEQNKDIVSPNSATGVRGVRRMGPNFQARIKLHGTYIHLGTYPTITQARDAYIAAKRKLHYGYIE